MIPLLIGAAAVGLGAVLMSDDKPKQESVTQNKRNISENQVQARLQRAGRRIKTVGGGNSPSNYGNSSSALLRFTCSGNFEKDRNRLGNMMDNISETDFIRAAVTIERYYNLNVLEDVNSSIMRFNCCGDVEKDIEKIDNMINGGHVSNENILRAIVEFERYYEINVLDN